MSGFDTDEGLGAPYDEGPGGIGARGDEELQREREELEREREQLREEREQLQREGEAIREERTEGGFETETD